VSQCGIEYGHDRVSAPLPTRETAENASDAGNITQGVGIDPQCGNAQLVQPSGDGSVLSRVVEDDEIGVPGQDGLDTRLDPIT
jgi:hypothetical protein